MGIDEAFMGDAQPSKGWKVLEIPSPFVMVYGVQPFETIYSILNNQHQSMIGKWYPCWCMIVKDYRGLDLV